MCVVFRRAQLWLFAWAFDPSKSARHGQAGSQVCVDCFELVQHSALREGMPIAKAGWSVGRSEMIDFKEVLGGDVLAALPVCRKLVTNPSAECRKSGRRQAELTLALALSTLAAT
jgi:hypothetical protein